jgi:hypothetical protein
MTPRILAVVLAASLLTAGTACSDGVDIEALAIGSDVLLTREDGVVLEGRLAARDDTSVQVQTARALKTVPRDEIADVRVAPADGSALPDLPAIARFREITVPAGTKIVLELDAPVSTETAKAEDPIRARLVQPVTVDATEVVPAGSLVEGQVLSAQPSGKVKGVATLALRFTRLTAHGEAYPIRGDLSLKASATKGEDARTIGIGAGVGAIVGAIIGGKKGAAAGAAIGGGAGTAQVLLTPGKDIALPRGTAISVALDRAVDVKVPLEADPPAAAERQ